MMAAESDNQMTMALANAYCLNLEERGFDDWRLPSFDEAVKFLASGAVTETPSNQYFWTTTSSFRDASADLRWRVLRQDFAMQRYPHDGALKARCVR